MYSSTNTLCHQIQANVSIKTINVHVCLCVFCRFTFPSVLIVYPTLTVLAVSILDLISFLPINSLLCNSDDFLENLSGGNSATPLCIFQGYYSYSSLCSPNAIVMLSLTLSVDCI